MNIRLLSTLAATCGSLILATTTGCGEAPTGVVQQQSSEPIPPEAAQQATVETAKDSPADAIPPAQAEVPSVESASYKPPFPDRVDLFAAPKRHDTQRVTSDGDSAETIHLVGFINVNGPRAILSFNGVEMPIGEGGTQNGVELISIQPNAVVLQRGRLRWQATLGE